MVLCSLPLVKKKARKQRLMIKHVRISEEQCRRKRNQDARRNIDGLVSRVLKSPAAPEDRVTREILVILAHVLPGSRMVCLGIEGSGSRHRGREPLMAFWILVLVMQGEQSGPKGHGRPLRRVIEGPRILVVHTEIQRLRGRFLLAVLQQPDALSQAPDGGVSNRTSIGGSAIWDDGIRELGAPRRRHVFQLGALTQGTIGDQTPPVVITAILALFRRTGGTAPGERTGAAMRLQSLRAHGPEEALRGQRGGMRATHPAAGTGGTTGGLAGGQGIAGRRRSSSRGGHLGPWLRRSSGVWPGGLIAIFGRDVGHARRDIAHGGRTRYIERFLHRRRGGGVRLCGLGRVAWNRHGFESISSRHRGGFYRAASLLMVLQGRYQF